MVYGIVYKKTWKRARVKGVLVPVFDYPLQAYYYLMKNLNGSRYLMIRKLRG